VIHFHHAISRCNCPLKNTCELITYKNTIQLVIYCFLLVKKKAIFFTVKHNHFKQNDSVILPRLWVSLSLHNGSPEIRWQSEWWVGYWCTHTAGYWNNKANGSPVSSRGSLHTFSWFISNRCMHVHRRRVLFSHFVLMLKQWSLCPRDYNMNVSLPGAVCTAESVVRHASPHFILP